MSHEICEQAPYVGLGERILQKAGWPRARRRQNDCEAALSSLEEAIKPHLDATKEPLAEGEEITLAEAVPVSRNPLKGVIRRMYIDQKSQNEIERTRKVSIKGTENGVTVIDDITESYSVSGIRPATSPSWSWGGTNRRYQPQRSYVYNDAEHVVTNFEVGPDGAITYATVSIADDTARVKDTYLLNHHRLLVNTAKAITGAIRSATSSRR